MALFSRTGPSFKQVVLVEYPRKGINSLAFATGISSANLQLISGDRLINVFLPTTPNPTTGFFLLIPEREVIPLQISVEDAFKLIISGGLVGPTEQNINGNDILMLPGAIAESYPQVNKSSFTRLNSLEAKEERKESIHVG